jgi:eukaryotic-like serine/threonine-protein kinase
MRCPKCHFENPADTDFCGKCASPLHPSQRAEDLPTELRSAPVRELTTGSTFAGRYQVIEELGRGGMGRVYKVFDTEVQEKVALKLLKPDIAGDREATDRFRNELKLARKIRHPRVCQMFDFNAHEGTPFITMEYVAGEDLKSMIRMSHQLSVGTAIHVARQLCEGLAEAHRLGVVHRDLKPQNVMIDRDGDARIMDFGIARSLEAKGVTGSGVIVGTPEYMSPEQVEAREVDQRSDIYSLGVILYEMLTGRVPFEGDTPLSVAMKQKTETPQPPAELNAQIPPDLSGVILKCLEKDKAGRYQNAGELLADLDRIQATFPAAGRLTPRRRGGTSDIVTVRWRRYLPYSAAVLALLVVALVGVTYLTRGRAPTLDSIAVLPFAFTNPDADTEYLRDGIPDSVISRLSELGSLKKVISSSSTARYKNRVVDPKQVGHELGVVAVLTGRIQRTGRGVSVSAELVNTEDGSLIWSRHYEQPLGAVLTLDETIARDTVEQLRLRLTGENKERLLRRATESPEAYQAYLRGRFYWNKRTRDGLMKGVTYFQKAIAKDPAYAPAYAGLSDSYCLLARYAYAPPNEAMPKAKAAAEKALEIDARLGEAHASLAYLKRQYEWDWPGAEAEFRKAIEFSPNYATAHHWYAMLLSQLARHEEAVARVARALELDPLSLIINTNVAWAYYFARQYDRAIEQFKRTIEMDLGYAVAHMRLGQTYIQKGMLEQAVAEFRKAVALSPESTEILAGLAHACAVSGNTREAGEILQKLSTLPSDQYVSPYDLAVAHAGLGQNARALDLLEKGFGERANMVFIKVEPRLDGLRAEPRFQAILRKMNLAD